MCVLGFQEQLTAAISLAMEQQMQKLLVETQLDMTEFDNLLQPIIDTCTKDAMLVRAGNLPRSRPRCLIRLRLVIFWLFLILRLERTGCSVTLRPPAHCELMASHLRNRITADGVHFKLRLHLIYLTNYILHHWWDAELSSELLCHIIMHLN